MTIRKITRRPEELGALALFSQLDEPSAGRSIGDPVRRAAFLEKLSKGLDASLASQARLHGWRVQAMFESMILGLGHVKLLSSEDEGDCFFDDVDGGVRVPDFRLVTSDNEHLLIEVKNVSPKDTPRRHTIPAIAVEGMQRYAEWTHARLAIAHYWSGANIWTLVDASRLKIANGKASLSIAEAMMANELGILGDRMIATTSPLALSLYPGKGDEPEVDPAKTSSFRVGRVTVSAGGRELRTKAERTIAFQLMLFGGWHVEEETEVHGGKLVRHDYAFRPYDPEGAENEQGFSVVASLSSLHATHYTFNTLHPEGQVETLRLEPEPGALAAIVPADYWDRAHRALRLWVFQIQPAATD
jgi:hypothetical protein